MTTIILNFHGVGPLPRTVEDSERNCWLDQNHFEAVLDATKGQSHVQLTFDDGNTSDIEVALPALLQRKLRAVFCICSGRLDLPHFLSRPQVQELLKQGMSIGSHGVGHVAWRGLAPDRLIAEITDSRRTLEQVCDRPVDTAACPFGAYDRHVLTALRQAGYARVYTSDGGMAVTDQWLQARITVTRSMSASDLQEIIRRGPGKWRQSSIDVRKFFKRLRW